MKFRKHQLEFNNIIERIISGSEKAREFLVYATPGAGKSSIPSIAGKLVKARKVEAICWVVPRKELQHQGETAFLDPFVRSMTGVDLTVRASTNEVDPCRGLNGFITTYQAVGTDKFRTVLSEFSKKRYVLILDEYHHLEKGGVWEESIIPLVNKAAYVVYMTGTLGRGDGTEISFTKYDRYGNPIIEDSDDLKVVRYSRSDALAEKAILPIEFKFVDGKLSWLDKDENRVDITSFRKASIKENAAALYTALNTEYARQLLAKAVNHWQRHRKINPYSKLLAVTDGIDNARRAVKELKKNGIHAEIATSHDSAEAQKNIRWFKQDLPALVTIAMAYEGMDVPSITHLCCLTHIRSTEWIEQMLARAVRVDRKAGPYETQRAYVFAPTDKKFLAVVDRIKSEQLSQTKKQLFSISHDKPEEQELPGFGGEKKPIVTPLAGSAHDGEVIIPKKIFTPAIITPKEQELVLRKDISKHVNTYCAQNRIKEEVFNSELKTMFSGKPRAMMTLQELEYLYSVLKERFPLSHIRGTGRLPVSKKVTPVYPTTRGDYGFGTY